MTYADLKEAALKFKAAVESKNAADVFATLSQFVKMAGDFFGSPALAKGRADASGKGDLITCCEEISAECEATHQSKGAAGAAGASAVAWLPLAMEIFNVIVSYLRKS